MKVLEQVEVQLQWEDLGKLTRHEYVECPRSKGVHVSDVLRYIAIKSKMYSEEDRTDDMPLRILLGMGFEEMAARLYGNLWWQPGEWDLDDGIGERIYGFPDGLEELERWIDDLWYDNQWMGHEFKYTGKSLRVPGGKANQFKDIRGEWLWMQQGMSYVNMLRKRGLNSNKMMFHICWKFGSYERPYQERYFKYLVEFEERELEGNLEMLRVHSGQVKGILEGR